MCTVDTRAHARNLCVCVCVCLKSEHFFIFRCILHALSLHKCVCIFPFRYLYIIYKYDGFTYIYVLLIY